MGEPSLRTAQPVQFVRCDPLLRFGRRHVKFVLVNGRSPLRQSFCVLCCNPIAEGSYLRDIRTRFCYCGTVCYAQSGRALALFENHAKTS